MRFSPAATCSRRNNSRSPSKRTAGSTADEEADEPAVIAAE
jgi:hypothetical protein